MGFIQTFLSRLSLFGYDSGDSSNTSAIVKAIVDQEEQQRVAQVQLHWQYYNGFHFTYPRADGDLPYANLCYAFVEKSIAWLIGKPPILRSRPEIQAINAELYNEILENSGGNRLYYETAQMGGVSGDAILQLVYDFSASYGEGGIRIKVLDSEKTFVEYLNVGNTKKLSRVLLFWEQVNEFGKFETRAELWTADTVTVYFNDIPYGFAGIPNVATAPYEMSTDNEGKTYRTYANPYGELPFIHIANLEVSQTVHGRSDLHDMIPLNKELNEQLSSYKDNVDYHGNPITLMYGMRAKDIEKGAHKVWSNLPKDGKVETLEVTQTHNAILEYIKLLEKYMGLAMFPVYLFGLSDRITSDTSAAALRLTFLPLIELTERKRLSYGYGFKMAFEMGLRLTNKFKDLGLESLDGTPERFAEKLAEIPSLTEDQKTKLIELRKLPFYYTEVIFQDYIPRNHSLELADIEKELQNRMESLKGALQRAGHSDPEAKMREIADSERFLAELDYDKVLISQGQDPNAPPDPEPETAEIETVTDSDGNAIDTVIADGEPATVQNAETTVAPAPQATQPPAKPPAAGKKGRKQKQSPAQIEQATGQSADRTIAQRAFKGGGEL